MTETPEFEVPLSHQILAARIQVTSDRKSGRETPTWVHELAERVIEHQPVPGVTPEQVAAAARIQVVADRKSGRQTEEWIRKLAVPS